MKAWDFAKDILAIRELLRILTGQESFFNDQNVKRTKFALLKFYEIMPEEEKRIPEMDEIGRIFAAIKKLDKNQQETIISIIGDNDSTDGGNILKFFAALIRAEGIDGLVSFLKNGFVKDSIDKKIMEGLNAINEESEKQNIGKGIKGWDKMKLLPISNYAVKDLLTQEFLCKPLIERLSTTSSFCFFAFISLILANLALVNITHDIVIVAFITSIIVLSKISKKGLSLRQVVSNDIENINDPKITKELNRLINDSCTDYLRSLDKHNQEITNQLSTENLNWIYEDVKVKFINSTPKEGGFYIIFGSWLIIFIAITLIHFWKW